MVRQPFLHAQIAALEPCGFVAFVAPMGDGVAFVEVQRSEEGDRYRIEAGVEPGAPEPVVAALRRLGLVTSRTAGALPPVGQSAEAGGCAALDGLDVDTSAELADRVLGDAFGCADAAPLDVRHGSRRSELAAARRLTELRAQLRSLLEAAVAGAPLEIDKQGDIAVVWQGVRIVVAGRVIDDGPALTRVMAIAAVDVEPSTALGLFLAQTNFELEFGRLAYDGQNRVIWFDISVVGGHIDEEVLRFALDMVGGGARDLGDRVQALFGGQAGVPPAEPASAGAASAAKRTVGAYL